MIENILFNFTDECGVYEKERSAMFLQSHPFYVRSNLIISASDYIKLEEAINEIKREFGVNFSTEIKWSHLGARLKKYKTPIHHNLNIQQLQIYYDKVIELLIGLSSVKVYYTFTVNSEIGKIDPINLLKMHLQNAFQRLQKDAKSSKSYGILIADELNDKTKNLKKALYEITSEGDQFTEYTHLHKGFFVDQSDQSCGLQIADILAGIFTASLKYQTAGDGEKSKFEYAHNLFVNKLYKIMRFRETPSFTTEVYKSGIKEIPSGYGDALAKEMCRLIEPSVSHLFLSNIFDEE